jgi:hypothetical protein
VSMTGLAGLAGFLGNTSGARTGTSVSSPTYTPAQTAVQDELGSNIEEGLTNPQETPQYESGVSSINEAYKGAGDNLTSQLAARGFGDSGGVGTGLQQLAVSKAGAVGQEENTVENQFENQAEGFGFASPGKSTVTVGPGSAAAGGLGATLASLQSSLNSAGSGGGL